MSQFHLVYDTIDGTTIQSFEDQRELNIYVEEQQIELYSTIKGKFLGHFYNDAILEDESDPDMDEADIEDFPDED